jgi:hypothetical protein
VTVSVLYSIRETPGNSVTGEWEPGAPAQVFVRSEVLTVTESDFKGFVKLASVYGVTIKRADGTRFWIPPQRIEQIEEVRE